MNNCSSESSPKSVFIAICENRHREVGFASFSSSSSTLHLSQFCDTLSYTNTLSMIYLHQPRLILLPSTASNSELLRFIKSNYKDIEVLWLDRKVFSETKGILFLKELACLEDASCLDIVISSKYLALACAAALTHHTQTSLNIVFLPHSLRTIFSGPEGTLLIDPGTIRALELIGPNVLPRSPASSTIPNSSKAIKSLFDVINHTKTISGAKLLRNTLIQPPSDASTILVRQECVQLMLDNEELFFGTTAALKAFTDADPILSLLVQTPMKVTPNSDTKQLAQEVKESISASSRRILAFKRLKLNLEAIPKLHQVLVKYLPQNQLLQAVCTNLENPELMEISQILVAYMSDFIPPQPSAILTPIEQKKSVGFRDVIYTIKEGVYGLMDAARRVYLERIDDIRTLFTSYQLQYPEVMSSSKLHYSSTRGYYMSIDGNPSGTGPKSSTRNRYTSTPSTMPPVNDPYRLRPSLILPTTFIMKIYKNNRLQFSSADMVALNGRLSESLNEVILLSAKLLLGIQAEICARIGVLYKLSESLSLLDMILSFAAYVTMCPVPCCRPQIVQDDTLAFSSGYHPILLSQSGCKAVPNNTFSSNETGSLHMLTGKNNSGKTTYLCQIGTLVIMAHMGSFIPAEFASFRPLDRLLSRFGSISSPIISSDPFDSSSSFFSEMKEMAFVIQAATTRSLVLLDEIGKTTSSTDAVPICMAICEHFLAKKIPTFFATHWIDMTHQLQHLYSTVVIQKMGSEGHQFKMGPGIEEDDGYGIALAKIAGWPQKVIEDAYRMRDALLKQAVAKNKEKEENKEEQWRRFQRMVVNEMRKAKAVMLSKEALDKFLRDLYRVYQAKKLELQSNQNMNELGYDNEARE